MRNWLNVVMGNYQEVGKLLDYMDTLDEERRKVAFIRHFHHLKPEKLKLSRSIAEGIVNNLVKDVIDYSDETENIRDNETRNDEKIHENKCLSKKDDESGYFEESFSNTSLIM